MKPLSRSLLILALLTGALALACALFGLFTPGGTGPYTFISVFGREVEMYGRGLYANNPAFSAPIARGTDLVTAFVAVPLLILTLVLASRGTFRGRLLLLGSLTYFLYASSSIALGTAYNFLFPVYIVYFAASLFAFILAYSSLDSAGLAARVTSRLPHGGSAGFLFFAGVALTFVWGMDIVAGYIEGRAPTMVLSYTTLTTHVLDLGIITPSLFLSGILLLRRSPAGYPLAALLLFMCSLIGLVVAGQSAAQVIDGVVLTPLEWATKVVPFLLMALVSGGILASFLRGIDEGETTAIQGEMITV